MSPSSDRICSSIQMRKYLCCFRSHDRLQKHVLVGVHNKREISSDCPLCRSNCDQDSAEGHRASFQSIIAEQKIIQSLTELLLNGQIFQPVNEAHSFCWETLSSLPELLSYRSRKSHQHVLMK